VLLNKHRKSKTGLNQYVIFILNIFYLIPKNNNKKIFFIFLKYFFISPAENGLKSFSPDFPQELRTNCSEV